jgi:hypothetical protein
MWEHIIILEEGNKKQILGSSISRKKKHPLQTIRSSKGASTNRRVKHWMFLSFSHKFNVYNLFTHHGGLK